MIDFIEYVVSEMKSRRLSRDDALALIRQFAGRAQAPQMAGTPVHPLLHSNVSDLGQLCHRSRFTGDEPFLRDHRVLFDGTTRRVLPGVAYLEMARAAAAAAWPDAPAAVELADVVWLRPIVVAQPREVYVALAGLGDDDAVEFEVFTREAQEEVVHCRGLARRLDGAQVASVDLGAIRARAGGAALDADEVYAAYGRMGLDFGPAHRAVRHVARGAGEALATLALVDAQEGGLAACVLHPGLMDGALQAALGLLADPAQAPARPALPFALDSAKVFAPCVGEMSAWLRHAPGSRAGDKVARLDIDLCDAEGRVCVALRGFASRPLAAPAQEAPSSALVLALPQWRTQPLEAAVRHLGRRLVVTAGLPAFEVSGAECHALPLPQAVADAAGFVEAALALLRVVRGALPTGALLQLVVPGDDERGELLLALSGLLKTAALEQPGWQGQVLLVDAATPASDLPALVDAEAVVGAAPVVRHRQGRRELPGWREWSPPAAPAHVAYREDGIYLVTGGLGGLGTVFARDILRQASGARVVLTGRGAPEAARLDAVAPDRAARARLDYRRLDLEDAAEVQRAVDEVLAKHGRLDGVLHAAGMVADQLIARKDEAEFARVLAPKVAGTLNLDAATRGVPLDFLALFSSGAATAGNAGQADYAVANGFLDRFAHLREAWAAAGLRQGRTLAVNWPLWAEGGMRMPPAVREAMREGVGMEALSTASGLEAFHRGLGQPAAQMAVVEGDAAKIRRALLDAPPPAAPAAAASAAAPDEALLAPTREYLRRQFAALFKLPAARLDPSAPLEKYGIDSILAMDLTRQLEKSFGPLPKTLFFEHQTVDELAAHFVQAHAAALRAMFGGAAPAAAPLAVASPAEGPGETPTVRRRRAARAVATRSAGQAEPIAIVGLSGRYPKAIDVEAYWRNLRDGVDAITEIPPGRWDWRDYYREGRDAEGAHYSKWGGFIDGVEEFDPLFFNIPPVDAEFIDPQERLFLQHAWMALEDAGLTRADLQRPHDTLEPGQAGVYVGVMYGEYQLFGAEASLQGRRVGVPVSYASVANRVSYLFNLHGPSMTVDTMCSSSLAAIHLACQDLRSGRTQLAIAGGVNVSIHPNKYLLLSAGQYISGEGRCQSFGEGGDGYIPGEGVGAVVLKRLSDAERDGDHVYGLVKGSALNHGGKTNGYSVPNPKAQASVIEQALREAGVDARRVGYVEAHGTGTRLGDPIEIAALTQVFRRSTEARGFCAIGSAKSNIGHCESAAGIAGLTKVLLQMKHRQLVPSLHSAVLNPHIDFAATPFVVNQVLRDWEAPVVDGRASARVAGLSSFGAGGSNAHLVVEEYVAPVQAPEAAGEPALVVLSARTPGQLAQRARDLLAFLEGAQAPVDLAGLAYTLQVGREAMDHRLAIVAASTGVLAERLQAVLRDEDDVEDCHRGGPARDGDGLVDLAQDEDMREAIGKWIARRKLARLAELWVRGTAVDWRALHAGRAPRRMSLPTYPFARERHWIGDRVRRGAAAPAGAVLHPLLHANTSDFFQQSYAATFRGDEFFLADHRLASPGGEPRAVLPGAAYLEMVRAAVERAWPAADEARGITLRHVAWTQPYVADGRQGALTVTLEAEAAGGLRFEVRSRPEGADEPVLHCEGRAEVAQAVEAAPVALEALREAMPHALPAPDEAYARLRRLGLHYGPAFRCLRAWQRGEDGLLATLALDAAQGEPQADGWGMHPALLDGALQCALGLVSLPDPDAPPVPFALESLEVFAPCAPGMQAWVRPAPGTGEGGVLKADIDLLDDDGRLCVRLRGLAARPLRVDGERDGVLVATPAWSPAPLEPAAPALTGRRHELLLCGLPALGEARLAQALPGAVVHRPAEEGDAAARYRAAALALFERVQALAQARRQAPSAPLPLLQVVVGGALDEHAEAALPAGLSGLVDSARREHPELVVQVLLVGAEVNEAGLAVHAAAGAARPSQSLLRCADALPKRPDWSTRSLRTDAVRAWRDGGVYLVTGGLGGLGRLFARDILAHAGEAVVVLTGRAPLDDDRRTALAALADAAGVPVGRVAYRALDLGDEAAVRALVDGVVAEFGGLHGVLHAAGMTHDRLLAHKTAAEFDAVLAPKVAGTVHLDRATASLELDFFALFSSLASALGNPGQTDYAAANGFLDRYAEHREGLVAAGLRRGRSIAFHWPFWQDGGMRLDADTLRGMAEASGLAPLATAHGLLAFHHGLAAGAPRVLVVEGRVSRLERALRRGHAVPSEAPVAVVVDSSAAGGVAALGRYLAGQFAELMKMPAHEIDPKAPLEAYGMDSVLAMKLTGRLERRFGTLSKTLFFEHQTLAALAAHLARAFPGTVQELAGVAPATPAATAVAEPRAFAMLPAKALPVAGARAGMPGPEDAIAIVGVAGRYPQAADLGEFWRNLREGRDCVTEIPPGRWDHAPLFHPERDQPGRTYSKWGGFLADVDRFDALFFNMSPREAALVDPQERLFIETVWEAIENAGYARSAFAGRRVGVYVGAMWGQYELWGTAPGAVGVPSSSFASIANRVSYFFDFHGPSLAVDTMCSSSLTAIHLACEELRKGALDLAVAGGVNVSVHPNKYLSLSQGNFASTDGRCRSFGAGGDGYVPGEGVGALLLKPLARALADGDRVHAVIKASAVNHGGKTNGYTVPNPVAQGELVAEALAKAGIAPATLGYVETHGTGTALGDPIEIAGLARAFEAAGGGVAPQSCAIGSLKSNIGHLESAAGVAAVTKAVLQLRHRQLVPSLHAERLNPHIDFERSPFRVQRGLQDWPRPAGHPRRAAVSSFGAGGANAHLVLEEFEDARTPVDRPRRPEAVLLSARTREGLAAVAARLAAFLDAAPEGVPELADIAYTTQVGRTPMSERLVVVAADVAELRERLGLWLADGPAAAVEGVHEGRPRDAAAGVASLIEGDAAQVFLQLTVAGRDLAKLAQLWIAGVEIDWAALHHDAPARRVALPSYPFARERHWIEVRTDVPAAAPTVPTPVSTPLAKPVSPPPAPRPPATLHYRDAWQALPAIAGTPSVPGPLLCLGVDAAFAAALERAQPGIGVSVASFVDDENTGTGLPALDPGDPDSFAALLEALAADGGLPRTLLLRAPAQGGLAQRLERGVHALHGLCRAWMARKPATGLRVVVWHDEADDELATQPLHVALAGYLRSLALENPSIAWKRVALEDGGDVDEAVALLTAELGDAAWQHAEVRLRGAAGTPRTRERRGLERLPEASLAAARRSGAAFRQGGCYLVSGGLGGLGLVFARHLLQAYDARLVLTGRSAPDVPALKALDALAGKPGRVAYVRADVADAAQARTAVQTARRRFGHLDGVLHAAGVHRDGYALVKTRADMDAVFAAKLQGTLNLDEATCDEPLDLFVAFASVAGVFGNPGQTDYAFANAFQDAFSQARRRAVAAGTRSGRTLAVDWPLWAEGGMRVAEADIERLASRTGLAPLPTAAGVQALEAALALDEAQALVLHGEAARIEAWLAGSAQAEAPAQQQGVPAAASSTLRAATEAHLKTLLGAEIGLPADRIDGQERFDAFGVDSMMAGRLNTALERDFGALPKTLLYEYASIDELADYLLQRAGAAVARRLGEAAPVPEPMRVPVHAPAAAPAELPALSANEPIAIVGLHGRFPRSKTLEDYWQHLRAGDELVELVPPGRWDREAFFDPDPEQARAGKIYCQWGGFLDDVDKFDAAFFGVPPEEARLIDPQERLFIESVWSAMDDAGYTRESLRRRHPKGRSADVGVFVGVTTNSYQMLAPEEWSRGNMVSPASMPWSIANRVSYFFGFQGPSLPVDTACSSSLVAIHSACESLRRGECQVAVAGGVNLYLHPAKYQSLCRRRMLAVDGKCRSYGEGDDGFIPSEGVGSVLLKPLSRAIADGDHIHGVIAASACEHAGSSNGYAVPNPNSQAMLIERTLREAGVDAGSVSYVEGHGTGTQLGDSLEVAALTQAFRKHTDEVGFCAIGSMKANAGHAESAAGMAALAKILLQFAHREIAPTLHSERVNPNIDFAPTPFRLQHRLSAWDVPAGQARRALVNSFGAGGVNACLLLQEPPAPAAAAAEAPAAPQLVPLSARNELRLRELVERLAQRLQATDLQAPETFRRLAATLQTGREPMEERLAVVAADAGALAEALAAWSAGRRGADVHAGRVEKHRRKKAGATLEEPRSPQTADELAALARRWVGGEEIDWAALQGEAPVRRLPLPGYPFARERYWVSDATAGRLAAAPQGAARLHPLIVHNVSTLRELAFLSSLSGGEFYGRDHQVDGGPLFPGAGFVELACVSGMLAGEAAVARLEDVAWVRPLPLGPGRQAVKTVLTPEGRHTAFTVVSRDQEGEPVLHAQGRIVYREGTGHAHAGPAEPPRAIASLKARATRTLAGAQCYRRLEGLGLRYGPSFRTIQELQGGEGFALAALRLPQALLADFEQYVLHPSLVDGALQAVFGAVPDAGAGATPFVPFALGAVELVQPLSPTCYALVERIGDAAPAAVQRFDIRLLSESGELLAALRDFCVRALRPAAQAARPQALAR